MHGCSHQKPLLKWAGGKEKELSVIQKYLPKKINLFAEPFVGGGSVFLNLGDGEIFINDKSKDLIDLYKLVQHQDFEFFDYLRAICLSWNRIGDFADSCKRSLEDLYTGMASVEKFVSENETALGKIAEEKIRLEKRDFYYAVGNKLKAKIRRTKKIARERGGISEKDIFDNMESALKSAFYVCMRNLYNSPSMINSNVLCKAIFYFLREYCYASMFRYNANGKFNVPYGGISYNRKDFVSKVEYLNSDTLHDKLRDVHISNLDFEDFLNSLALQREDFVFLDPPYDSAFSEYSRIQFDKDEQRRLSKFLRNTKAMFLLVIKNTDFIYELYKDFYISSFDKKYLVSFKNRNNKEARHLIITNYRT